MSIADEIRKLAALRDEGILSEDEFQAQKNALIGPNKLNAAATASPYDEGVEHDVSGDNPKWSDVALTKKWWFQLLATLLIIPLGLILMMAQKAYFKKRDGSVAKRSVAMKLLFAVLALGVWAFNIAAITSDSSMWTSSTSDIASCDSYLAKGALKDAIENNANANLETLRLLDLKDFQSISFDPVAQTRKCNAVFVLNSGTEQLGYQMSMSSDGYLLVEIAEPYDEQIENEKAQSAVSAQEEVAQIPEESELDLRSIRALGLNLDYVKAQIGPPKRAYGEYQEFETDGCLTTVKGLSTISSISFDTSCPAKWTYIIANWNGPENIQGTTVGEFFNSYGAISVLDGCFKGCGNAADPVLRLGFEGSRADGFIQVIVGVTIAGDDAVEAMSAVRSKIELAYSSDDFEELYDLEDVNHPDSRDWVVTAFNSVEIESVEFGSSLIE